MKNESTVTVGRVTTIVNEWTISGARIEAAVDKNGRIDSLAIIPREGKPITRDDLKQAMSRIEALQAEGSRIFGDAL